MSACSRAENTIKNKSKFYQKSLTQAWVFFSFLEYQRILFDTFSGFDILDVDDEIKATNWVAQIQPGRIMFEIDGVDEKMAREAFSLASAKLPFETMFVKRTIM